MTLTEALLVLSLIAIAAGFATTQASRGLDVVRVRAARDAAFAVAARARTIAVAHGGADLIFDFSDTTVTVVDAAGATVAHAAINEYQVALVATGSATRIALRYDARGIGRMASQTLRFRRGFAEAGLTVSSYGRIRRW